MELWLAGQYLISKFADQLGVIVVCFDDLCFATGQMRGALDEVRPQGSLGQKDLVWIQVHLSDHFVGHLRNNAVQHLQQFNNSLKTEKLTLDMNQNKNTIQIKKRKKPVLTLTKVSPMIFRFSSGLVVMFKVLLMRLRGVLSSSEMGSVVVPL